MILLFLIASFLIKNKIWRKRFRWTSLILFLVFSNGFIFNECMLLWEKPAIPLSELSNNYDMAVVLGGTADVERTPSDRLYFQKGADRITHALNLYHSGKVKKILYSGGSGRLMENSTVDNSPIIDFYIMCGVDPDDILIENSSRNTHENALFVKNMLIDYSLEGKIILVTSAYHMRRAEGCFNKVGVDVTGFSTDFYTSKPDDRFRFEKLIPSPKVLDNWNFLIKEWIGYVAYWIVGYI